MCSSCRFSEMNPYCEERSSVLVDNVHGKLWHLHTFLLKERILEQQFMLMIHHLASQRQTAELRSISYLWEVMYSIQLQCALMFKKMQTNGKHKVAGRRPLALNGNLNLITNDTYMNFLSTLRKTLSLAFLLYRTSNLSLYSIIA